MKGEREGERESERARENLTSSTNSYCGGGGGVQSARGGEAVFGVFVSRHGAPERVDSESPASGSVEKREGRKRMLREERG